MSATTLAHQEAVWRVGQSFESRTLGSARIEGFWYVVGGVASTSPFALFRPIRGVRCHGTLRAKRYVRVRDVRDAATT